MNIKNIYVVIPAYKVIDAIEGVINNIPDFITKIIVVDDACPQHSGHFVEQLKHSKVIVLYNTINQGVGGAVMAGYIAALNDGAQVIVKVDGDGQMDPNLIPYFIQPILYGEADYTKGNRFYNLEKIRQMPSTRLWGNAILSLMTKFSSGYWTLFDPTNGYTAIHADVVRDLPMSKISKRYFFETDILFRLNTLRAVVVDVPMDAVYGNEKSNLKISKILGEFFFKHIRNSIKRIFYNYYLRDLSLASIELPLGLTMFFFGIFYGSWHWFNSSHIGIATPAGTVMLAAMPMLMGLQLILAFIGFDIASVPKRPIHHINFKDANKSLLNKVLD